MIVDLLGSVVGRFQGSRKWTTMIGAFLPGKASLQSFIRGGKLVWDLQKIFVDLIIL